MDKLQDGSKGLKKDRSFKKETFTEKGVTIDLIVKKDLGNSNIFAKDMPEY